MSLERLDIKGIRVDKANFTETQAGKNLNEVVSINFKKINQKIDAADLKKDDITALLEKYGQDSSKKNRKNISSFEFDNNKNTLTINYKDSNLKKIINEDLSYQTIQKNTNKSGAEEVISFYNADNTLSKENIITDNSSVEILFDKNKKKYQTTEFDKNKNTTTVIKFDESENPEFKSVTCGSTISLFDFKGENNSERILEKTENKGLPIEKRESYTYRDDGYVEIRTYSSSLDAGNNSPDNTSTKSAELNTDNNVKNDNSDNASATQNCTVQCCSMDNFDPKTGDVKDKDKLVTEKEDNGDATKNSDNDTESKKVSDNNEKSVSTEQKGNNENITKENNTVNEQTNNETSKSDKETKKSNNDTNNDTKTPEVKTTENTKPQTNNPDDVNLGVSANNTTNPTKSFNKSNEVLTETSKNSNTQPHQQDITNAGRDNSIVQNNRTTNVSVSSSNERIEKILSKASISLENFIERYASEQNIPPAKVRELIGLGGNKINLIKHINASNFNSVSDQINNLERLLDNAVINIEDIRIAISNINEIIFNKNKYTPISEPIEISDITKISAQTGIKASEISSVLNNLKNNDSIIVNFNSKTDGIYENRIYRLDKSADGVVTLTELKLTEETKVNTNTILQHKIQDYHDNMEYGTTDIKQVRLELRSFVPPELRAEFDKCKSVEEFKNFIEKHSIKANKYTKEESVRQNITDSDLKFKYIFNDGILRKVPINKITAENNPVEELRLDVIADKEMLNEIVNLMTKGAYKGKNGKIVKIKTQNMIMKTASSVDSWASNNEPLIIQFDEKVSKELEQAIREIASKYLRKKTHNNILDEKDNVLIPQNVVTADAEKNEKIIQILNGLGIPNAQTIAFIASMAYISSDGIRKTSVNKNSNETELSFAQTVNMKDSVD